MELEARSGKFLSLDRYLSHSKVPLGLLPIVAATNQAYFVGMKSNFVQANATTDSQSQDGSRDGADLINSLDQGSRIYQDYERAFSETTGLPVSLRTVESWQLPHRGKRHENSFCAMMAGKSRACAACLRLQEKLSENARNEPQTLTCELGLCDTAVPIRMGERLVGFLQTGQVFRKKPTKTQFERTAELVRPSGEWRWRRTASNRPFSPRKWFHQSSMKPP